VSNLQFLGYRLIPLFHPAIFAVCLLQVVLLWCYLGRPQDVCYRVAFHT